MSWNKRNNRNNMHGATIKKSIYSTVCYGRSENWSSFCSL